MEEIGNIESWQIEAPIPFTFIVDLQLFASEFILERFDAPAGC